MDCPACTSSLGHRGLYWYRAVPVLGGVRLLGNKRYSLYDKVRVALPTLVIPSPHPPLYPAAARSEDDALMPLPGRFTPCKKS